MAPKKEQKRKDEEEDVEDEEEYSEECQDDAEDDNEEDGSDEEEEEEESDDEDDEDDEDPDAESNNIKLKLAMEGVEGVRILDVSDADENRIPSYSKVIAAIKKKVGVASEDALMIKYTRSGEVTIIDDKKSWKLFRNWYWYEQLDEKRVKLNISVAGPTPFSSGVMGQSSDTIPAPAAAPRRGSSEFNFSGTDDQIDTSVFDGIDAGEMIQWRKMRVLGKGSFGTVYEGITANTQIMAVKVLEIPADDADSHAIAELTHEINLMRTLRHRNIVAYYGSQQKKQESGMTLVEIFLQHCHGGCLNSLRKRYDPENGRFSVQLARNYTRQVLEGLAYLHSKGVVHRDIKGDNVLVSGTGEAKLADFGCSKKVDTEMMAKGGGGEGCKTMVGTPLWMAPEILNESAAYGATADIWSVGCVVIELFGRKPWNEGTSLWNTIYLISQSTTPPTGIPPGCPPAMQSFFDRCFERNPAKRATANELLAHEWLVCPDSQLQEPVFDE